MHKNPPANAGDTGSIPDVKDPTCLTPAKARVPQLLSPSSRAQEPRLLKSTFLEPVFHHKRSRRSEKPVHLNKA